MKLKQGIAAAIVAMAAVASQPAAAYEINPTGQTLASPRLVADVLTTISRYSKATGGCSFVFSARMAVAPRSAVAADVAARGGHAEQWTVNACAAKQRFLVSMWPSPRGGTDYAVTPLTGRMPLWVQ